MALLITIGTANYRDFTLGQQVETMKRTLTGNLNSIKTDANSGVKKPAGCTGSLNGYVVSFNVNATPVGNTTRATGFNVYTLCPTTPNLVKTYNFNANEFVIVNRTVSNAYFTFKPIESGTDIQTGNPIVITVGNSKTSRIGTVTVNESGEIQ